MRCKQPFRQLLSDAILQYIVMSNSFVVQNTAQFPTLYKFYLYFYAMKILIIEDEKEMRETLEKFLLKQHYRVETACSYSTAMDKITIYDYDCILLDIMLPDGSGLDILSKLKALNKSENVIITSAKDSLDDKVGGLALGADDYLAKPFHLAELNARIKAVFRRKNLGGQNRVELANVVLDLDERVCMVDSKPVHLNKKEFDILNYFIVNKERLIRKTTLAEYVWGDNIDQVDNFDFIYYQIKNLRKKIDASGADISIESVYGMGYKLTEK